MAKSELFGYKLNETSGVLLFLFGILTILGGTGFLFMTLQTWSLTDAVPPAGLIISMAIIGFGFFILIAAIAVKSKKTSRRNSPKSEKKSYLTADGKPSNLSHKEIDKRRKQV
jgi:TRAP-type C4-dicarboxylate transport system permease small subunit